MEEGFYDKNFGFVKEFNRLVKSLNVFIQAACNCVYEEIIRINSGNRQPGSVSGRTGSSWGNFKDLIQN